jgi:hypothetical protein
MISPFRARRGFTSVDFPGVSPTTRFGSYINIPGYIFPNPELVLTNKMLSWFSPQSQGILRLPQLFIKGPNAIPLSTIINMATPAIRKGRTGSVTF